jgi:hypothetical protein
VNHAAKHGNQAAVRQAFWLTDREEDMRMQEAMERFNQSR